MTKTVGGSVNLETVSKDLEMRITAGRQWLESGMELGFPGPAVRKCPTSVKVVEFLDTPDRVERFGLGFVVTVEASQQSISFQINIRIKPHRTNAPTTDSYPYVVSYVVDQVRGLESLICFDHIVEPQNYVGALSLTTQEWYLRWLSLALDRGGGKLFSPEVRMRT